jgi:hypothetical protein
VTSRISSFSTPELSVAEMVTGSEPSRWPPAIRPDASTEKESAGVGSETVTRAP